MEYNSKYIHFEYTDDLIGKWCIARDSVCDIKSILTNDDDNIKGQLVQLIENHDDCTYPFCTTLPINMESSELCTWKFVYVDPAFQNVMNEKTIVLRKDLARWLARGYGQLLNLENDRVYTHFYYDSKYENIPVDREKFKVREWNETEWKDVEAILNEEYK